MSRAELAKDLVADLVRVRPAPGSPWVALRASTTVLLALSGLAAAGRIDLAPYAAFGAFASLYGGALRAPGRWRVQVRLGTLLTAAVLSGAVVATWDARTWISLPVAAGWAVLASRLSMRQRWRPPGPLFLVFAAATSASIPTEPAGAVVATGVAAGTASLAVLLGVAEVAVLGAVTSGGAAGGTGPRGADAVDAGTPSWRLPVACGLAALVAGSVAAGAGLTHPSWAVVAAVVPFAATPLRGQVVRGLHRVAGTAAGLGLAALLLTAAPYPVWVLVLVVAALQATTELLVVRHYGMAMVFITPLALLLTQVADPRPAAELLVSRIVETVLGVSIGLVVALLTRSLGTSSRV